MRSNPNSAGVEKVKDEDPEPIYWTKEEQDNLGRPLIKWDQCPHCELPAGEHFFDRRLNALRCPQSLSEWDDTQTLDEFQRTQRVPRSFWKGGVTPGEILNDEAVGRFVSGRRGGKSRLVAEGGEIRVKRRQPATSDGKPRKYFDAD